MKRSHSSFKSDQNKIKVSCITNYYSQHITNEIDRNKGDRNRWECFICGLTVPNTTSWINIHIDKCVSSSSSSSSQKNTSSMPSLRKISPSLISNDVNDKVNVNININDIIVSTTVPGLIIIQNFISDSEEISLVDSLNNDNRVPWKYSSFNGHCFSKQYGVKTQYGLPGEDRLVRKNDNSKGEYDLPESTDFLIQRLRSMVKCYPDIFPDCVHKFEPNECNANQYLKSRKDYLKSHFDDRFLSGEVLMNLSMMSPSYMTYKDTSSQKEVDIYLPRGCLQLVTELARYNFTHGIKEENILDEMRISLTLRQAGDVKKGVVGIVPNGNRSMIDYTTQSSK